jgi:hypothetical protein
MAGIEGAWTHDGPSESARDLRTNYGHALTPAQRVLLSAAWGLWDGSESIRIACLWRESPAWCEALTALVIAQGQGTASLDRWIDKHQHLAVRATGGEIGTVTRSGTHPIVAETFLSAGSN